MSGTVLDEQYPGWRSTFRRWMHDVLQSGITSPALLQGKAALEASDFGRQTIVE